jgi:hypothetical protein
MARRHRPDLEYVWRAVVTNRYANGKEYVIHAGPYTAKGYIKTGGYWADADTTVVYQRSKLEWETVEEAHG